MNKPIEVGSLVVQIKNSCVNGCESDLMGVPFYVKSLGRGIGECGVCGLKDRHAVLYATKEFLEEGMEFSVPVWALKRIDGLDEPIEQTSELEHQ